MTFELDLNNKETGKDIKAEGTAPTKPQRPEGVIKSGDGVIWQERAWGPEVGDEAGQADCGSRA